MYTKLWEENTRERDHLKYLGVARRILKGILKKYYERAD
jgi:hypothetical protein